MAALATSGTAGEGTGMTPPTSPQHPLEGIYRARDALDTAASALLRADVTRLDWPAYGSGLMGVLSSLSYFNRVLVDRIDETDRDRLYRDALRDHPHEALDRAVEHLEHLRQVLTTAVSDVEEYWSEVRGIYDDTRSTDE